jgi:hypothetical protein
MRWAFFKGTIVLFLVFTLIFGGHINADPVYAGNESDCAFTNSCEDDDGTSSGSSTSSGAASSPASTGATLGRLIAIGGGHFLQSLSDIHRFLGLIESSEATGADFEAIQEAVNAAILNMEKAQDTYYQLKGLAAITPYNQVVINRLIDFDFEGFQKQTGLLPTIFDQVRAYLAAGDVRGIYQRFYDQTGDLLERLRIIKSAVDGGQFPSLAIAWRLNQKCTEYKLFGQYVAEVFYKIK